MSTRLSYDSSPRRKVIYAITRAGDEATVVYVGQAFDVRQRLRSHRNSGGNYLLREWLAITPDARMVELERAYPEDALDREGWWYERFLEAGMPLLNQVPPRRLKPSRPAELSGPLHPPGLVRFEELARHKNSGVCG